MRSCGDAWALGGPARRAARHGADDVGIIVCVAIHPQEAINAPVILSCAVPEAWSNRAMGRVHPALAVILLAPLLGGAASPGQTPPELAALGWRKIDWTGLRPAEFTATASGGVRIQGQGQGSFITRRLQGPPGCLAWRWRVDAGPPATDLTRRGGDDRAVALSIGFAGFAPQAGFVLRAQHAVAQASAGQVTLPRSALTYAWGGTGREGQGQSGGFFSSPWTAGITRVRILRPAETQRGQWVEERVDLAADWRQAFGGQEVPGLMELVISTDAEDTGARVDAQVENIRLVPCR